jgi:hypothetical protein
MTGPKAILYEITYDDPEVYTAPWTAQLEWSRDDTYFMAEYACHEGDVQIRNYIRSSRAKREAIAKGELDPKTSDGLERFEKQFDIDPVSPAAPKPAPRPAPAAEKPKAGG